MIWLAQPSPGTKIKKQKHTVFKILQSPVSYGLIMLYVKIFAKLHVKVLNPGS